ncbi:MAG TPA: hypothetical protein VM782_13540 [Stellaceae bacterium]|nr:hypothetical protein [Stellaceae bacterium]
MRELAEGVLDMRDFMKSQRRGQAEPAWGPGAMPHALDGTQPQAQNCDVALTAFMDRAS